ncbi:formyltransferase family protein [Streptomyces sp. NPDC048172]|uniref:formyltransferase family protein n=1 Tax=Streptomyces sp. NPDC048172 TaxID=3365505 RepID=UPI0037171E2F
MVSQRIDCILVGDNNLLIACADVLLNSGHDIRAVITSDPDVAAWAEDRKIAAVAQGPGVTVDVSSLDAVDFLFSVGNYFIVPGELLALPREFALNVHDSPLPRLAGRYATSWAIADEEKEHGVTWHVMAPLFDSGDVVKQCRFPLGSAETAASLDIRCFLTAVTLFEELVDELATGRYVRTPQDLSRRTQHTLRERPDSVISWEWPARRVDAAVRATDFGSRDNPFGVTRLRAGDAFFIPLRSRVVTEAPTAAPGTVISARDGTLVVSAATGDVALGPFVTLEGEPVPALPGVAPGDRLHGLTAHEREALHRLTRAALRAERSWLAGAEEEHGVSRPLPVPEGLAPLFSPRGPFLRDRAYRYRSRFAGGGRGR